MMIREKGTGVAAPAKFTAHRVTPGWMWTVVDGRFVSVLYNPTAPVTYGATTNTTTAWKVSA